ncbi:hypothetical protein ACOMHN_020174 [Nucella lapillus]
MKRTNKNHEVSSLEVKKSDSAAPPTVLSVEEESDLPIDRGYAWVIVFACLLCNVICLGLQRAYGILFVAFLDLFAMPVGITSLVMSVQSAFTSVSALLTQTVMLSLLSERQTIIIGSLCGSVGITLSYFATNLFLLIITQSVLVGIANGMIMGPTMVIVGKYFDKHRSIAMAVAILGGNLGSMTMPLFTEALLETFGIRGTFLVLGAFFLNIMVFAGLLRPLHLNRRRRRKNDVNTTEKQMLSLDNPQLKKLMDEQHDRWSLCEGQGRPHTSTDLLKGSHLCVSTPELSMATKINLTGDDDNDDDDDSNDRDNNDATYELRLLKNDDATGDQTHLHLANNNHDCAKPANSTQLHKQQKKKKKSFCRRFLDMFDFSLFKQPRFLLALASCSLAFLPAAAFGMYLPAMAVDKGVTGHRVALLLTIFGGCGIASRLGFGYLADMNCVRRVYLMAMLMAVTCVAGLFTPLYTDFATLAFFSIIYGLFGVVFFSLMPVVLVDLMGLHNMAKTLGFVQLFQGVVLALSHPVIGHLRDVTGQYHASYYFMSGAGLLCAFLLLFTPCVTRQKSAADHAKSPPHTSHERLDLSID